MASAINPSKIDPVPTAIQPVKMGEKAESFSRGWLLKQIYLAYANLPIPVAKNQRKVVLLTEDFGGKGDFAAGYKVLNVIEQIDPQAIISWATDNARKALHFKEPSSTCKITAKRESGFEYGEEVDLMIQGPAVNNGNTSEYLQDRFKIRFKGDPYKFVEICVFYDKGINWSALVDRFEKIIPSYEIETRSNNGTFGFIFRDCSTEKRSFTEFNNEQQRQMYDAVFEECLNSHVLGLSLDESSGLFFEEETVPTTLSHVHFHPEALLEIENKLLAEQLGINSSSTASQQSSIQNYTVSQSLNFGYAHYTDVKGRFIDCVAMHENKKDLTFVFYQVEKKADPSRQAYFQRRVFTSQRLALLKRLGYGKVVIKSDENLGDITIQLSTKEKSRIMTVILYQSFSKKDMRSLQLASERILATGDNSACEAFISRFKLYMYEDISECRDAEEHIGSSFAKGKFLKQQIGLAAEVYPPLGRFMTLSSEETSLTEEQMSEMEKILSDPAIASASLKLAETINRNYQFKPLLEGMIRRHFWHRHYPELYDMEKRILLDHTMLTNAIAQKYFTKSVDVVATLPYDIPFQLRESIIKQRSGITLTSYFPKAIAELVHSFAY